MIPDKLYISQLIYGTWQYQTPDPDDETQVEYIRKDALLEWARKNIEQFPLNDERNDKEIGFVTGICALINKLNSM